MRRLYSVNEGRPAAVNRAESVTGISGTDKVYKIDKNMLLGHILSNPNLLTPLFTCVTLERICAFLHKAWPELKKEQLFGQTGVKRVKQQY